MSRIHNLDYLRGIFALLIAIYHFLSWQGCIFNADSFVYRLCLFGVNSFYCLSGLTLFLVYSKVDLSKRTNIGKFYVTRFFRIFPLFWLALLLTIVITRRADWQTLFLNITGLYAVVDWNNYIVTGSWSIGNELVYYLFFPILFLGFNFSKVFGIAMCVISFALLIYFAFRVVGRTPNILQEWLNYVNPLNHIFFFVAGLMIGLFFKKSEFSQRYLILALIFVISIYKLYPAVGSPVNLLYGLNRIVFSLNTVALVLIFYKIEIKLPDVLHRPLEAFGKSSYSIYILHPIVYFLILRTFEKLELNNLVLCWSFKLFGFIIATIFLSYFSWRYFETGFINLGKKLCREK
ncbi:exopolysaccharide production protein ExoZ [Pedobacter africanus]|uniref:Peptidoglycan/LPS O-acetylase OafA/YrhL n=1 Tax=Pedobacter africanus TaxID=151894 RepID=A0ACC6L444_9SPHI|nr:acyltransferase [Pedobacter africanus]MDR6786142.1 peptidoglycan/LPS O-acetylase OafA/YrhL [Pedobacter africanus]